MKAESFTIGRFDCVMCKGADAEKNVYILYPGELPPAVVEAMAEKYGMSIAVITGMDWDNDLTPWPARGVPAGSPDFEGLAAEFLDTLTGAVIPEIERRVGCHGTPERDLIGVSLSGLFTLWQWARSDFFHSIATLSGSFWYSGFVQWVVEQPFAGKSGRCYMLLGDAEPRSGNRVFATVGKCTEEIVGALRRKGVSVTYESVRGNHYQYPGERLAKALTHMAWKD